MSLVGHRVERHGDGQDQHVVLAWLDLHAVVVRHPEPLLRDLGDFVPPLADGVDAHLRQLKAYEHAFYEGDPQNHIFRVKQGMLRLYLLLADGRRQVISFRFPGHVVGLCDQDTQFYSAEAVTSTVLQCLPLSVVRRRVDEEVKFGSELIRCLAVELAETQNKWHFSIIALPWRNWRPSFSAFGPESRCAQEARRCMAAALYASLNADQKRRLGSVAVRVLPELRDAFDTRRSDV